LAREDFFPEIITNLPRADVPGERVRAYLLQGERKQVVFVAFDDDADAPEEVHAAQWVVVLDGEVELTTAGETAVYRRGDTYFVPAGAPHAARVKAGSRLLDIFDEPDRYRVK
jgi:quercetin dioxygenase-like cupin family protein